MGLLELLLHLSSTHPDDWPQCMRPDPEYFHAYAGRQRDADGDADQNYLEEFAVGSHVQFLGLHI